jgi:DNA-binding protein YbaB
MSNPDVPPELVNYLVRAIQNHEDEFSKRNFTGEAIGIVRVTINSFGVMTELDISPDYFEPKHKMLVEKLTVQAYKAAIDNMDVAYKESIVAKKTELVEEIKRYFPESDADQYMQNLGRSKFLD